jgi:hypothetical protein
VLQIKKIQSAMETKSITDLPNEVIEKYIMVYLDFNALCSIGSIGIERFNQMAEYPKKM